MVYLVWYDPFYNEHGPYLDRIFSSKEVAEKYINGLGESGRSMTIEEFPIDQDN